MTRQTNRWLVLVSLMVATFLTAMEAMVVGTAMPTIIGQLGGLALISWVFSAYLLTSTVTVPIYGKFADLYGRKPVFLAGTTLFLLGSALCGTARSMEELIVFRAIQGLGAGAVLPITITIIGDVFTLEERARYTGLFSSVWGLASILGPAIGGFLTDNVSWRWIFYINLPIGLLAMGLLLLTFHERVERREHQIDVAGAALLAGGLTALMFALLAGGRGDWTAPTVLGLFTLAVVLLALFVRQERRAPEPIVPLDLFAVRIIGVSAALSFLVGFAMFGTNSFVPTYVQGVLGLTASSAGAVLTAQALAWSVGSVVGGRVILRLGYRVAALVGLSALSLAAFALTRVEPWMGLGAVAALTGLTGLGLGFCVLAATLAVQNAVPWARRGAATSSNLLSRMIGGTVGVSVAGAVFTASVAAETARLGAGGVPEINALLDPATRPTVPADLLPGLVAALETALHHVFLLVLAVGLAGLLVALRLPGGRAEQHAYRAEPSPPLAPGANGRPVGPAAAAEQPGRSSAGRSGA